MDPEHILTELDRIQLLIDSVFSGRVNSMDAIALIEDKIARLHRKVAERS